MRSDVFLRWDLNYDDLVLYPGDGWTRVGHGIPKAERAGVEYGSYFRCAN